MILIKHNEVLGGRAAAIDLEGPLDSSTAADLEDYLNGLCDRGIVFFTINASGLNYMSSSGIGVVVRIQKRVSDFKGCFVVYALPTDMRTLFNILGFDRILRIAEGRIEAMEIIDKQIEMRDYYDENPVSIEEADQRDVSGSEEGESRESFSPFIIECENCSSLVRVRYPGEFKCPECGIHFFADHDKNIKFTPFI